VLQQLSSGSKINSGADDAAGLSLVNGLRPTQTALAQSKTNASEGVGLLQVADGALSQVTNLLNRAVTLATEASNGTLNGSQDTAANQEYQSILDEVNNIGTTTTYNQQAVFNSNTNIYTGDSSTAGASIDDLNIRRCPLPAWATPPAPWPTAAARQTAMCLSTCRSFSGTATAAGAANADILSGSITFQVGNGTATTVTMAQVATADQIAQGAVTLDNLKSYINSDSALGVTAGDAVGGKLTLASTSATHPSLNVSSNLVDNSIAAGPAALNYTATAAYSAGLTTGTFGTTGITDSTTAQITPSDLLQLGTASGGGGIATISYSDKAGQSLSGSDLSSQGDAETALTQLNTAISDVAAQDGYIGAQINTLNAASQVLSTQQENITSAQNAVQATDYATATSNMSKYEILSQTGIAALAQANSVQQEVTKLLQ
jgi:flagellin